jgi:hypothetical protein
MRISVFSPDGELLARWGNQTFDRDAALFHAPHAVAVDSRGDVYVGEVPKTYARMDKGAHSIHKFRRVS